MSVTPAPEAHAHTKKDFQVCTRREKFVSDPPLALRAVRLHVLPDVKNERDGGDRKRAGLEPLDYWRQPAFSELVATKVVLSLVCNDR